MIKILQIREAPLNKCDGLDANCQALIELFGGDIDIEMLPTINYTRHTIPILKQFYLDEQEICKSIERTEPSIIHVHGAYSFTLWVVVKCAKKYKIPIAFSPHFHPFWALRRPKMGKIFFKLITKKVLRDISVVFTINNEDTFFFKKYHKSVIRIPHWAKYEIPSTPPTKNPKMVLFVGRLNESNKGFEHLYHLPIDKYEIHCVGKGDVFLRPDMKIHTNISDEELAALYQQSSLLVVPSRYEAFSYVTLEALANYTPVVLSDRVRIADYLNGFSGVSCFKFNDYDDFALKVENTIGKDVNPYDIIGTFSPQVIKEKYKSAYLEILSNSRG